MKKVTKLAALFLAITMSFALASPLKMQWFADVDDVTVLQELNLLDKEGNTPEKLDAKLTRAEGLTMVLKALGYSQAEANKEENLKLNTFTDIPEWFKGYAGLGVHLKIATGKSLQSFDPKTTMTKHEFLTFVLRALQHDSAKAWKDADALAKDNDLVERDVQIEEPITKREAASVILNALNAKMQSGDRSQTLGGFLIERKAVSREKALTYDIKLTYEDAFDEVQKIFDDLDWTTKRIDGADADLTAIKAKKTLIAERKTSFAVVHYMITAGEQEAIRYMREGSKEFGEKKQDAQIQIGEEYQMFEAPDMKIVVVREDEVVVFFFGLDLEETAKLAKKIGL